MAQFDAGLLCCSNLACALVRVANAWEKLPHQTEISFNSQASVTGLVTSDTNGRQGVSCGTVATTGTLGLACHDGDSARFAINARYLIRFSHSCEAIWTPESGSDEYGSPVADPEDGTYYEGIILITGEPVSLNISASDTPVVVYAWTLDGDWIAEPDTIVPDLT